MSISSSPERHTFQKEAYIKRQKEKGEELNSEYVEMFDIWKQQNEDRVKDTEWQKNNLEYDLRSTDWILKKTRDSEVYAQNLYAAICNNEFVKLEVLPILKEESCSYSWRYAGGIIADMCLRGDYMDWYCSGIGGMVGENDGRAGFVSESVVTDEIHEDLKKLGWAVITDQKY